MLEVCKQHQLDRYREFAIKRKIPVYLVVGLGGVDDYPDDLFVIPLEQMKYPSLYPNIFSQFSKTRIIIFIGKMGNSFNIFTRLKLREKYIVNQMKGQI